MYLNKLYMEYAEREREQWREQNVRLYPNTVVLVYALEQWSHNLQLFALLVENPNATPVQHWYRRFFGWKYFFQNIPKTKYNHLSLLAFDPIAILYDACDFCTQTNANTKPLTPENWPIHAIAIWAICFHKDFRLIVSVDARALSLSGGLEYSLDCFSSILSSVCFVCVWFAVVVNITKAQYILSTKKKKRKKK